MQPPITRIAQGALHLADLFNWTSSQLLWEASSHAAITARRLLIHKYPPLSIARYSLIQLGKLEEWEWKTCLRFYNGSTGFEPGFSSSRVHGSNHCATALLLELSLTRSDINMKLLIGVFLCLLHTYSFHSIQHNLLPVDATPELFLSACRCLVLFVASS